MRVKRIVAPTMQEAMAKVKEEMGKDAVILHTKKIREGGILGLFSREMIEVTAAVDNTPKKPVPKKDPAPPPKPLTSGGIELKAEHPFPSPPAQRPQGPQSLSAVVSALTAAEAALPGGLGKNRDKEDKEVKELRKEFNEVKSMMKRILFRLDNDKDGLAPEQGKALDMQARLVENDVSKALAIELTEGLTDSEESLGILEERIADRLGQPQPIAVGGKTSRVVAMVGPTGVGKTTTIAKLAATFSIVEKRRVALITADTYRIAAVEQLKTFGEIIGVPVDVVFTPHQLQQAVERHQDKDLILIDTAGRSHKNETQMGELQEYTEMVRPDEIILVLSATTKYQDLREVVERFSSLDVDKLIFTKLDETTSYGVLLNIVHDTRLAMSYLTTGQNVPDDIEVANPRKLAKMILGVTGQ